MIDNKFFFIFFLLLYNLCSAQFFYTGYQELENWTKTNNAKNVLSSDSLSSWEKYYLKKKVQFKDNYHFGIFLNLHNASKSNIIANKSDLIGNGLLTYYHFMLPRIEVVNSMFFSNRMQELKRGFVRTIKDVSMYTNQAYLKYSNDISDLKNSIKIGRDFLTEGYGIGSKLFFSDYSRPFDQFTIEAEYGKISGKFTAMNLDIIQNHNRYLYMHSIKYSNTNLSITVGEAIISTGIDKSIDLKYLNPFNFWAWENLGSLTKGLNAFLFTGFEFFSKKKIRVYGELLFDDINFHNSGEYYLNKYAYLIGFHKTSFPFSSSNLWLEHSNVLNQVYQSYHPTHIYTHRGFPIGHYLGNDFINNRFHYSQIIDSVNFKVFFDFSYLIQGVNNIDTPFDNPWEDSAGNKIVNYKHPGFPTPPLTKIIDVDFGIELSLKHLSNLSISIQNQKISKNNFQLAYKLRLWSYLDIF